MKDGKLGCGGLIAIILLVFAFFNDFASELGEALQLFFLDWSYHYNCCSS